MEMHIWNTATINMKHLTLLMAQLNYTTYILLEWTLLLLHELFFYTQNFASTVHVGQNVTNLKERAE